MIHKKYMLAMILFISMGVENFIQASSSQKRTRDENLQSEGDEQVELLMEAIDRNDTKRIKTLIKNNVNLNRVSKEGHTALTKASEQGNLTIVSHILLAGADVNAVNSCGQTPLIVTSELNGRVAPLLLIARADVNIVTKYGVSALYYASDNGNAELVDMLLKRGANVNATEVDGWSPLMVAALGGYIKVTKQLITAGADVNLFNIDNDDAFSLAAKMASNGSKKVNKYKKVMNELRIAGADTNITYDDFSAWMVAASKSHKKVSKQLITAGADIHAVNCYGDDAAYWAKTWKVVALLKR